MQYFGIGFLVLIFLEIMSIVWVADWIGGGWTLFVMAVSFISGIFMLRHTGISGLLLAGAAVRSGQNISLYQMLWPIRYTAAAVFLLSPGFISTADEDIIEGEYTVTRTGKADKPQDYIEHKPD